ncbi:hypothetical protein [Tunicatimonas pelagia]|uniref:hypothetical protein n=1 Tax=Tunicatimonas pelagia TaxID=931531 RepID=UPI002666F5DD|nr:hypothetical protein [Tunicatimonas pelagia]WKN42123.1 hypothetical protein P0M28_24105 [Tunicatimonas pelagia]
MKIILFYCLLIVSVFVYTPPTAAQDKFENSSLVIVKAPNLTGDQYGQLSSAIAPDNRYSVEYICLQSGIIVLRYYHNFSAKGDVGMAIKTALRRHGKLTSLEVIYVDISRESSVQC